MRPGREPTGMVVLTLLVRTSITETLPGRDECVT